MRNGLCYDFVYGQLFSPNKRCKRIEEKNNKRKKKVYESRL